ncbi:hypothetical protein LINPERHAP2_LOCUS24926, partial [Linum perenne]
METLTLEGGESEDEEENVLVLNFNRGAKIV